MEITGCISQERVYGFVDPARDQAMSNLIERLKSLPDNRRVWLLNSMDRLCLLGEDDWATAWNVIVEWTSSGYTVEHYLPHRRAGDWGWLGLERVAETVDAAVNMVLVAMERSEGWPDQDPPTSPAIK